MEGTKFGILVLAVTVGCAPEGTSVRNRKQQIADILNSTGCYSMVRNPFYLVNFFVGLGESLFFCVWYVPVIYSLMFIYYELIIFAEEMFLTQKFVQFYVNWATNTPMLFSCIKNWQYTVPLCEKNIIN
ncbi:hypothetical protein KKE26_05100 [bacterium]|nr:hypothetical protein [bacterium]MBU1752646.1 hypothetical protein [bacterium]